MIEFIKEKKIFFIIGGLVVAIIGWNLYNSISVEEGYNTDNMLVLENTSIKEDTEDIIAVHITGEIKKPGVVKLKEGSRIEDIIKAAGGLTENADITNVNLAYVVEDGVKIRIPSVKDETTEDENYIMEGSGKGVIISDENQGNSNGLININTATQVELEELPGVGASISSRIVDYRSKNGKFKTIEDIKNVTGIGESKFEKIKDFIKVK